MKHLLQVFTFLIGLFLASMYAVASPEVDHMSNIEVSEYAARMSQVMADIQYRQICTSQDTHCVRAEFARQGVSYDDKESVQKRLALMIGSMR